MKFFRFKITLKKKSLLRGPHEVAVLTQTVRTDICAESAEMTKIMVTLTQ